MKKLLLYFVLSFVALESYAVNYYSKSTGNLQDTANWGTNTDGSGTAPANFTANGNIFYIRNRTTATIGAAWTVSGTGSKVVLGDPSVAAINFTLPSNTGRTLNGTLDITAASSGTNTLTINNQVPPTMGTLHSSSTVIYNATGAQSVASGTYGNIRFTNNRGGNLITLPTDATIYVTGNLTSSATFTPSTSAGDKYFYYFNSTFEFNGTGAQGIDVNEYFKFYNLNINNSSSTQTVDYTTTDVSGQDNQRYIDGTLTLTQGKFDIGTVQLWLSGDIAADGNGVIRGAATAGDTLPLTQLFIVGEGAISGELRMDTTTPGNTNFVSDFQYNRSHDATESSYNNQSVLKLGTDFGVLRNLFFGSITPTTNNGVTTYGFTAPLDSATRKSQIDINGKTLTIGGQVAPSSGFYPRLNFIGSATSKLVFMHNANYTGNTRFYMDQTTPGTTNRLQSITIDRRNSSFGIFLAPFNAYGNPVIVKDITFAGTSTSFICLNSNELTIEGNITGMNANNYFRSRVSTTGNYSRLNIAGTGALSSSLFFDQTSVTNGTDVLVGTGLANDTLKTLVTTATDNCNNFNRLTINRSGQTITLGNKIAISGKVVPTAGTLASAGNLVMLSSNTITSNIGSLTSGTSAITGDVVVQSYFKGDDPYYSRGFRMISFPVQEKSSPNNLIKIMQNRFIITGSGGTTNGFDAGGVKQPYAATFMTYNESPSTNAASYTSLPSISTATSTGLGYFFFFRGNRKQYKPVSTKVNDTNNIFATPESWTATYTGTINSGDITQAVTRTNNSGDSYNGYNLLGNPYPCTIDFELLRAGNTSTLGATTSAGTICMIKRDRTGYITRSGGVSNNTDYPGSVSTGSGSDIRYIQPGQGFFVKAIASGNVTFKESYKVPDQAPPRMLSAPVGDGGITLNGGPAKASARTSNEVEAPRQLIRMSIEKGEQYEQATLVLEPGNDANYADADAVYFGGNDVILNTLTADNINTCINFLPEIAMGDSVKLFVNAVNNLDNADLNFSELTALGSQYAILLKDKYLNTETRIGEGVNKYQFSIDKAVAASFGANRFVITFVPKLVLSVKLLSFTASKTSTGVHLAWKTGNEKDNDKFDIERSTDGTNFVKIGEKLGVGNSNTEQNYSFDDKAPVQGANYYRLKAIDKDGKSTFSEIQAVNFDLNANETALSVYPNPVKNELNAVWQGKLGETYTLLVVDLGGKQIKQVKTQKQSLKSDVSHLPKGLYLLQMKGTKGSQGVFKFIKE